MNNQNNIDAINNLSKKLTGETSNASTIADAINYIADNYSDPSADLMPYKELLEGTASGDYESDKITKIRDYALYYDEKLTSINLPNLLKLGTSMLNGAKVTSANFENATGSAVGVFKDCTRLLTVNIPKVTEIGSSCFASCTKITKIDLPSVTSISSNGPFSYCKALVTLILRSTKIVSLSSSSYVFNDTPIASGTGYIYVPKSLIESYKAHENWKTFADQFRAIEDYPDICGGE